MTKSKEEKMVKDFTIIDNSKFKDETETSSKPEPIYAMTVSIWGDNADKIKLPIGCIIVIKRAKIRCFNNRHQINVTDHDEFYYK
eukprot:CAMPEP_0168337438 /NCGR_PEP_ID=MMETSP0213-20121227/12185_1 /TAXON_ID=151035 /ORGANISM="Euplotes harpa, Strain FSP1.4" /LENGTH=84 /DNA_ID=CAMNT_0008342917 /DNA_START=843 /DNA_END=1097 /DNA_ORIENTATION=-